MSDERTHGQIDKQTDRLTDALASGWMDRMKTDPAPKSEADRIKHFWRRYFTLFDGLTDIHRDILTDGWKD